MGFKKIFFIRIIFEYKWFFDIFLIVFSQPEISFYSGDIISSIMVYLYIVFSFL